MNLFLLLMTIVVSFIIVRIGVIAFQLTGLTWSQARFQALSCFSGTGFTTRESELIVGNAQRKWISSILIVLGNAGLVTLIATFANSLRPAPLMKQFTIPFLHSVIPSNFIPVINFAIIIAVIFFMFKFFSRSRLLKKLTRIMRNRMVASEIIKTAAFEELFLATGGYGVANVEIYEGAPVSGNLRTYGMSL